MRIEICMCVTSDYQEFPICSRVGYALVQKGNENGTCLRLFAVAESVQQFAHNDTRKISNPKSGHPKIGILVMDLFHFSHCAPFSA